MSLDAQRQQIAGYAMMKGWRVAEHFVERGVSGSIPLANRPEGARLLSTIGKGDVVAYAGPTAPSARPRSCAGDARGAQGSGCRSASDRSRRQRHR